MTRAHHVKLDVLHVLPSFGLGGAERVVVELLRQNDSAQLATGVVCLGAPLGTPLEAQLAAAGVPVWFLGKDRPGFSPRGAARLYRLVEDCGARLLHTHLHVMPYVLPLLAARRDLRCVHTVHNLARRELRGLPRVAQRLALRLGTVPVAVAHAVKRSVQALYGVPQVMLIPNGIPVTRYIAQPGDRQRVRAELGLPADAFVFACFARLAPQKNHASLLESFRIGFARDPRAHLLLIGDGPLRAELRARIGEPGLERVHLLGERQDIVPLLAAADAVVLASRWEGSPLAVMEAMAAGRPVVATSVGGVPELLQHRKTGLLVLANAPRALALAMQQLRTDAALREQLGTAAQQAARHRLDSAPMARRYQALYHHLLLPKNGSDPFSTKNGSDPFSTLPKKGSDPFSILVPKNGSDPFFTDPFFSPKKGR